MISLNLGHPVEYPLLQNVLDVRLLNEHLKDRVVEVEQHSDGVTRLYHYTPRCVQLSLWNEVTTICRGLIVREGKVIARPISKFFMKDTPGLPETEERNFPPGAEITDMIDGTQGVFYLNSHGTPMISTAKSMKAHIAMSASIQWRRKFTNSQWPEGYTPVVQIVGPLWRRVCTYLTEELILIALVRREDGAELPYGQLVDWATHNDMRVAELWHQNQAGALIAETSHRGFVFRWKIEGEQYMRVGVETARYAKFRSVLMGVTPFMLWEKLQTTETLGTLKDPDLPPGFVAWVTYWEAMMLSRRTALRSDIEKIVREVWSEERTPSKIERDGAISKAVRLCEDRVHLLGGIIAGIDRRSIDPYVWGEIRKTVLGQAAYQFQK